MLKRNRGLRGDCSQGANGIRDLVDVVGYHFVRRSLTAKLDSNETLRRWVRILSLKRWWNGMEGHVVFGIGRIDHLTLDQAYKSNSPFPVQS